MYLLKIIFAFISFIPLCLLAHEDIGRCIQANASLLFDVKTKKNICQGKKAHKPLLESGDVAQLWNKIQKSLGNETEYHQAIDCYYQGIAFLESNEKEKALSQFKSSYRNLALLLDRNLAKEADFVHEIVLRDKGVKNLDFENNAAIPDNIKKEMRPFVIQDEHPLKQKMDQIFFLSRCTQNKRAFRKAGFKTLDVGPRSHVHVASHPEMPGYLVKAYMDNELKEKRGRPSWQWLVKRCEGAKKVSRIIEKKQIRHFTVASKWIYPLPEMPAPPAGPDHVRHYALLLVTDMQLTPKNDNYSAWKEIITPAHLDELYVIISRAKGSSYRPDNIPYTRKGNFAFIDTEYPSQGPDYSSIRTYLSKEMKDYWDYLVRNGGP